MSISHISDLSLLNHKLNTRGIPTECSDLDHNTQLFKDLQSLSGKKKRKQSKKTQNFFDFTEVFAWGDDSFGQLGLYHQKIKKGIQDQLSFKVPKTCSFNILIKQISCGEQHSAILTSQGHLYMMGSNIDGQLGIGSNLPQFQVQNSAGAPCLVDQLKDIFISSVECGSNFTMAIAPQVNPISEQPDTIYGWGSNYYGQLGLGDIQKVDFPNKIEYFNQLNVNISKISAGKHHSLFTTVQGNVYACGSNSHGQLGLEHFSQNRSQIPQAVERLQGVPIIQTSAGQYHSLFLSSTGEVYACGSNSVSQLGIQDLPQNQNYPIKIQSLQNYEIVQVEANSHSAAVTCNGELFLWGSGVFGLYKIPQKILTISNKVQTVSLGASLGAAVDNKGLLWTWGTNNSGELGVGDNEPRMHPYPVLSLKGKVVTQMKCGGQFIVALGSDLRKEIPSLKLKKEKKKSTSRNRKRSNSKDKITQSCSKKRTASMTNLLRNQSSSSIKPPLEASPNKKSLKQRTLKRSLDKSAPKQQQTNLRIKQNYPTQGSGISLSNQNFSNQFYKKESFNQPIPVYEKQLNTNSFIKSSKGESEYQSKKQGSSMLSSPNKQCSNETKVKSNDLSNIDMGCIENVTSGFNSAINKEQKIRDLQTENKSFRTEIEHLKKDNKMLKVQIESLEKQGDRVKHESRSSEMGQIMNETKKKDAKIQKLKDKKKELQRMLAPMKDQFENIIREKDKAQRDQKNLSDYISKIENDNRSLKEKLTNTELKNDQLQKEIREFENDVQLIQLQSKQVEEGLLRQLQDLSEKYKNAMKQKEDLMYTQKQTQMTLDMTQSQAKEQSYYTSALEKENAFLREEVERSKYSKDKQEYNKFVSSLMQIKKKPSDTSQYQRSYNSSKINNDEIIVKSQQSPFKEIINREITKESFRKSTETDLFTKSEVVLRRDQENIEPSEKELQSFDLRQSYNQKLLKSIEKKTLNRHRCI